MSTSEQLLPPKITNCGRSAYDFLVSNLFLVALVTYLPTMTAPMLIPNTALTDKVHAMCGMAQGILCTLEQAAVIIYKFSLICWKTA